MNPINEPLLDSSSVRPRLRVTVGGLEAKGAFKANVSSNNRLTAARFGVSFALDLDPDRNAAWWSEQKDVPISVYVGLTGDEGLTPYQHLVTGTTDHIHYHPVHGTLQIEGRDLASRLIDATTRETFANKRSSEIVQILAARHGLTADVTPTSTLAGVYYQLEHDKITLDGFSKQTKEWDLLVYLAQNENYDLYMGGPFGDVLHFHPAQKPDTENPYLVRWKPNILQSTTPTLNASDLNCERSLTLAKDVKVTVKSWNGARNTRTLATYPKGNSQGGGGSRGRSGGTPVQNYVFVRPGLSQGQAEREAERLHKEITQNERVINVVLPGELKISPRTMIRLEGTGTTWDQTYYVDEVTRNIGWEEGFTENVRAKNSSPRNQATVG